MTMIERVAFGLAVKFGYIYAQGTHGEAWVQMKANNAPSYRHCMEAARAAIEAMREPTEAMRMVAWLMDGRGNEAAYAAMIDAALEEGK